jgi:hypothetical protein
MCHPSSFRPGAVIRTTCNAKAGCTAIRHPERMIGARAATAGEALADPPIGVMPAEAPRARLVL